MKFPVKRLAIFSLLISIPIFYLGWNKFLRTDPPSLPEQSAFANKQNNLLPGIYYQVSIPPTKDDQYLSADYRIWIPDGVQKIRGLIVKQHGCGDPAAETGLDHANDLQWQALAFKHQFALLSTKLPTKDKPCEYWALINYGSGKAFFKALHAFAQKSDRPELESVPWVLWGHSGGADWIAQMMQEYPDRTIAVVAARGGAFLFLGSNPNLADIPVLFAIGENDREWANETQTLPKEVFSRYRKINSLWAIASEANTAHEIGNTRLLAIPYFDAIINLRLPKQGNNLNPIDKNRGWLADPVSQKISLIDKFEGNPLEAAWLPNEETARKWKEYITIGRISPTRKPEAPTDVSAKQINPKEVLITWHFTPDLENGLPSFRIYRDNSLIATLQGQVHNFGDAPKPPNVVLEFQDQNSKKNAVYKVAAFNDRGESVLRSTRPISSISLPNYSH